jgi:hypothetical protein
MAQLPPKKRKKRRVQLREAQRRRRARLKEESKSFLQIILSHQMLMALRQYSDSVGKPLHASAAELIERGLDRMRRLELSLQQEQQDESAPEHLSPANGEHLTNGQPSQPTDEIKPGRSPGQMELFAG